MTNNKSLRRGGSALALGLASIVFAPGVALAQDTGASSADDSSGEGEIVVTGFSASLQSAVNAKKNRDQVVESISAEDIGKLPDASIAESIARLPGLTSQRVSGRSNAISIRGFAPDFSTTLLNGETYVQGGSSGTDRPEVRQTDGVFRLLSGANTSSLDFMYPRNFVAPDDLSSFEKHHLREAFAIVRSAQHSLGRRYLTHVVS